MQNETEKEKKKKTINTARHTLFQLKNSEAPEKQPPILESRRRSWGFGRRAREKESPSEKGNYVGTDLSTRRGTR